MYMEWSGADPELFLGGGANPCGGGCLPTILIIFSEKRYEIKEILVHRGCALGAPPKSATGGGSICRWWGHLTTIDGN